MTRYLEISGLSYSYDDGTEALKNVNLTVEHGEKVAIVGPNGAGKSTLLHLIAGFRMPFAGRVEICGRYLDQKSAKEIRKSLGLLFQDPDDQIFMPTVEEDVAFGPRNLGLDGIEARVKTGMQGAGVEHLASRRPHRLSYGMKKRVAIAGLLAMDPSILLLDEPTSGLDPKARSDFVMLLRKLDRTMLIATHDLEAAAEIVDRAVVLNGSVVREGTLKELVMDRELIQNAGLEMPPVSKLFAVLDSMGYPVGELPVSMDQAVAELTKVLDRDGRHIHAHVHEHEHRVGNMHSHEHREDA